MSKGIFIVLLFLYITSYSQQNVVSFNQLLQSLEQNYKLKDNASNADSVFKLRNKINNASYLPQFNLISQVTYQSDVTQLPISIPYVTIPSLDRDQYKIALEANQVIYDASMTNIKNKRDALSSQIEALQSKLNLTAQKDLLNKWVYFYLIYSKTKNQLFEQKNVLLKKYSELEKLINGGLATSTDLDLLKVEILKIEQQLESLNIVSENILTNIEVLTTLDLRNKSVSYEDEQIIISDTIKRDELVLYEKRENMSNISAELASKSRLPLLYAFGQAGYGKPGLNMLSNEFSTFYLVGAKMVFTLYDWGKSTKEKKIAEINRHSINNERELFLQNIKIQSNELIANIQKTEKWIEKDKEIIQLRENILKSSSAKLSNGTAKITDYLNDLNAKTQALIKIKKHIIEKQYYIQSYKILTGIK